jgi:hypothetical protein
MKIEIDRYSQEAMDQIFVAILADDYKNVKQELNRLKNSDLSLKCNNEDIKYHKKLRKAYKTIMRYCMTAQQIEEILGKKEKESV